MASAEQLRLCARCSELKELQDFAWKRKGRGHRDNLCRACRAVSSREHYVANRQRYINRARVRKQAVRLERTKFLIRYFEDHPCVDCGEDDPVVLEFDHLGNKEFNIGTELAYRTWPSILEEIKKCDVVCANCHRRRTAHRSGSLRALLTAGRRAARSRAGDRT